MKIVLAGAGNTATILGRLMIRSGHEIVQVVSRTIENAKVLATELGAEYDLLTSPSYKDSDLVIVALHDHALGTLDKYPALKNKFLVHTAGSVSIHLLENCSDRSGVLYPLQTLSKYVEDIPAIPFLVDGNNAETLDIVRQFALSLSSKVEHADDERRKRYHIAAVFASNFSNHIFALTELFCQRENLDFKNVLPVIDETVSKIKKYSPYLTQTGPAMRNDVFTINKHLDALSPYPDIKNMYLKLTENIIKIHGKR